MPKIVLKRISIRFNYNFNKNNELYKYKNIPYNKANAGGQRS